MSGCGHFVEARVVPLPRAREVRLPSAHCFRTSEDGGASRARGTRNPRRTTCRTARTECGKVRKQSRNSKAHHGRASDLPESRGGPWLLRATIRLLRAGPGSPGARSPSSGRRPGCSGTRSGCPGQRSAPLGSHRAPRGGGGRRPTLKCAPTIPKCAPGPNVLPPPPNVIPLS